jgi:hypothetical protein
MHRERSLLVEKMKLTAIFEEWHLGDGNYAPLRKGQIVNLSFEIELTSIETTDGEMQATDMGQIDEGMYQFCGRVLRVYEDSSDIIVVVQTNDFTFYIDWLSKEAPPHEGNIVRGQGKLLLDHYAWVEFLSEYKNPPDLFYTLKVTRIRAVHIPESFVQRHEKGYSYPASLKPEQYPTEDVIEIENMAGQPFEVAFYIVDFDDDGLEGVRIPPTFRQRS